ncbi:zeatin O-glucosyltransferase-like [Malania oleifera]|uniref:zeatin O-glucosyltransferase-like n=1 Tax=Malania oleifera TaxID=397392 RepID=UPI0025AE71B3|nr:zeatin O-glucosyltransferase-like [Malania oleifera]
MAAHHPHHQNGTDHSYDHDHDDQVVVIMVPFPAQGHLNQLLHLSRLISSYRIPVHYVGAATHNRQAKARVHGWDHDGALAKPKIYFHDFPVPPFASPPPIPNSPTQFPSHLQPAFDASSHLRQPVAALLGELSNRVRRVVVIHDSLMAYVVQDAVLFENTESYSFHSVSAFATLLSRWETMQRPPSITAEIPKHIQNSIPPLEGCFTDQFLDFVRFQHMFLKLDSGCIYNTCKAIETSFVDLLGREEMNINKRRHWAIGPFNPVKIPVRRTNGSHRCLEWLDKQEENSVLYVSFGTTTAMTEEQIGELALGLERSEQKFIWVLRDADKGDVFAGENGSLRAKSKLPNGYEERVEGVGMVVREWAPQLEILAHRSTGGFMSHCGWNSCMESMSMGVPMAAWPMHSDQPRNTVLVTAVLGVGVVAREWARRKEVVRAGEIERVVRKLMASPEGEEMRERAAELGGAVRRSAAEDGGSRAELDSFIAHITRKL